MKTAPLTDSEINFIKWRIWEPLRRNQNYRNEFGKLYKDGAEFKYDDPNPICEKWDISYPISPDFDFDQLYGPLDGESAEDAKKRIQGLFIERYVPESDDAAFTNIFDCLVSEWSGNKKKTPRHHAEKWSLCFQIYDMVEGGLTYPKISTKLNEKINTIHKRYRRAWHSIYPGEEYPTKRHRKREIAVESLRKDCTTCNDRICEKSLSVPISFEKRTARGFHD